MDVIVTENQNLSRQFRVNDVDNSKEAIGKVIEGQAGSPLETGKQDNTTYSTQVAPPRPANPSQPAAPTR